MARRTVTILSDDFDGTESEDVSTVTFAYNGKTYSIDLTPKNADKLEKALTPFIEKATRTSSGNSQGRPRQGRASGSRPDLDAVREWAKAQGHQVGDRGRIKGEVLAAYDAAH